MGLREKLPSLEYVYKGAIAAIRRFPFAMAGACIAAVAAVIAIEHNDVPDNDLAERILAVSALGISWFTALTLYAEKRSWSTAARLGLQAFGLVLLVLYYFSLPSQLDGIQYMIPIRFVLLAIVSHSLVAFLPWLHGGQTHGFWQYNKSLFLRLLISALYSAVLFVGLVIALAALDKLFGVHVDEEVYFQLWVVMAFLFNTWVFLAGLPENLHDLDQVEEYPKGLKVFAQYILLPLAALYLVILYFYEAKIIVQWNWPRGWVSELILWYSVVGILSLLLLWPLREQTVNRWVRTFATWFFRLLVPLVVMLFFAILERVGDYGITVNRYLVIAMAVGLSIVVIYFIFSRRKDIRVIPIVICLLALLSAYGPWSAFGISVASQGDRLDTYLKKYNLPKTGSSVQSSVEIASEDRQQMSSITDYINRWHGVDAFARWLPDSALVTVDTTSRYGVPVHDLTKLLGFEYVPYFDAFGYYAIRAYPERSMYVAGFDYVVAIEDRGAIGAALPPIEIDATPLYLSWQNQELGQCRIRFGDTLTGTRDDITINILDSLELRTTYGEFDSLPAEQMTIRAESPHYEIALALRNVSVSTRQDTTRLDWLRAWLLVRNKGAGETVKP